MRRWIGEGGWVIDVVACGGRPRLRVRRRGTIVRYCERVEELNGLRDLDLASFVEVVDFPHAPAGDDRVRPASDGGREDAPAAGRARQPTREDVTARSGGTVPLLGVVSEREESGAVVSSPVLPGRVAASCDEGKPAADQPAALARQEALCLFEVDMRNGRYVVPDL